jgi:hypothetical protein
MPQFLALCSPYSTNLMGATKRTKSRASSGSQEEKHLSGDTDHCDDDEKEDVSCFGTELSSCLCWEVRNRVWIMFKWPVSVWRL